MKGWKTLAFAGLTGLIAALSTPEMAQYVADNLSWLGPVFGLIIAGLRAFTNSSIFKSTSPAPLPPPPPDV